MSDIGYGHAYVPRWYHEDVVSIRTVKRLGNWINFLKLTKNANKTASYVVSWRCPSCDCVEQFVHDVEEE